MGQPAAAARHRGGEPAAARAVPGGRQPRGAGVEHRVDRRGVSRVLDGAAAVALDEGQHDVLAAQRPRAGRRPARRGRRRRRTPPRTRARRAGSRGPASPSRRPAPRRCGRRPARAGRAAGRARGRRARRRRARPRPRVAAVRCRSASRPSRRAASVMRTTTASARTTPATAAPTPAAGPNDPATNSCALANSTQSKTGSNGRASTDRNPMSSALTIVSTPSTAPPVRRGEPADAPRQHEQEGDAGDRLHRDPHERGGRELVDSAER